jgi:hypothetical protein
MLKRFAIGLSTLVAVALVIQAVSAQSPPAQQAPAHNHGAAPAETQAAPGNQPAMSHERMHAEHMARMHAVEPSLPGQDTFGAIAEVVRLLDADPKTDWSKVNLERLRQHLIDMNEVVLRSAVTQSPVPAGLAMEVRGAGRTTEAIRSMVVPHAVELDRMPQWSAKAETMPDGVKLTVTAKEAGDAKTIARIRGLGFIGLLTEGAHHGPHHLAIAKGQAIAGHAH